jgi:hypothetical protein
MVVIKWRKINQYLEDNSQGKLTTGNKRITTKDSVKEMVHHMKRFKERVK